MDHADDRHPIARATPPFGASDAAYADWVHAEVAHWRARILKPPSLLDDAARVIQGRITRIIPEPVHATLTAVIEGLTRTILTGADLTTSRPVLGMSLSERDHRAAACIDGYRKTAAVEGGVAGAGGFWLALADFPALLVIKMKLLFDLSAIYGHEADRFDERLYILNLFQLAFSSPHQRPAAFATIDNWDARTHPTDDTHFDWRAFQQTYRDYIDLAKLAQMIPIVGAPIGAVVNWSLLERLGETAMNGYRQRALLV